MSAPVLTPVAVELGPHTGHCYAVCDANHALVPVECLARAVNEAEALRAERDALAAKVAVLVDECLKGRSDKQHMSSATEEAYASARIRTDECGALS